MKASSPSQNSFIFQALQIEDDLISKSMRTRLFQPTQNIVDSTGNNIGHRQLGQGDNLQGLRSFVHLDLRKRGLRQYQ